ncbi:MAG TPA: CDP-glucose 4,6-dehydratase [Acetobacteraceae bacterium]|nr:CDP-glucose 4,6-dehydratase [Acetobacteraceae bacterium]
MSAVMEPKPAAPSAEFWRGKRVFLTGHTGFKGGWLSLWLTRLGAQVTGYALPPEGERNLFTLARIEEVVASRFGDVRDAAGLAAAMRAADPEIVLHLAAQPLVRLSYEDPLSTFATNVMGTANLLEAARRCPSLRAMVMITSDKCYENREWDWPYRENEAMGGYDPYSASKGCAELAIAAWRRSYFNAPESPGVASVRAGNVVGGGDWSADRLVPDCIRAFSAGAPISIRSPRAIRPWQHVLEPLRGYMLVAERLWQAPRHYSEGWNFGPVQDDVKPVLWVVARVAELWGGGARWEVPGGTHPHEAIQLRLDSTKARAQLDWTPRIHLVQCLEWTVKWYREVYAGAPAQPVTVRQIELYEQLLAA